MQDLNDKINNGGATAAGQLSADEWNQLPSEVQNAIESAGIALAGGDLTQLVKSIAQYAAVGQFATGAGVADAYTAVVIAPAIAPPTLKNGMIVRTVISNTNTGASTLNAFGLGVIDIKLQGGVDDLVVGDLVVSEESVFTYRTAPSAHWELTSFVAPVQSGELPLAVLDYPTIDTANNSMTITPAIATNGGTVGTPGNVLVSLGEEITTGETGTMRPIKTAVYNSADLDVSSTYYLRAKFVAGVFTIYTQKGTDSDTIPVGLVGTIDGAAGGGFDSTVLDVLMGRVVTDTAGTLPVVTSLVNKKELSLFYAGGLNSADTIYDGAMNAFGSIEIELNWARSPTTDIVTRVNAGNVVAWVEGLYTTLFAVKGQVAAYVAGAFDKTYILSRYRSKIPIAVTMASTGTLDVNFYQFEVFIK